METKRGWWKTYFWGNVLAEVEKDDSKDTFACDDEAHKVDTLLLLTECNTALSKYLVSIQDLLMQYVQQVAL